jgi:hypothetical protein
MDLMIRLKELQRRMDHVLGQPKMSDRDRVRNTITARLTRVEDQVIHINIKIDDCLNLLKTICNIKNEIEVIKNDDNKNI